MTTFRSQPLRAQKRARTRVRLVEALHEQLHGSTLDDVSVSALAAAADISQATFYNYFPTKQHLLTHYVQLWSLQMGVLAQGIVEANDSALAAIEALFVETAALSARNPSVMLEIIAHQARGSHPGVGEIELAERLLWLDDAPDAATLSDQGLQGVVPLLLERAVAAGELPAGSDTQLLFLTVASLFFGVPLLLGRTAPEAMAPMLRSQLQMLWAGARAVEVS